ncbi:hypothetical protein [Streptomyces roseochromogenus]|uniref:hypothetical protein n=1 Tax=Streptomyces roseochromogenus TaxID=285450 RepID=UPI00131A1CBD|nr:hypothetical protein [Streptomyces roseochromogenus]
MDQAGNLFTSEDEGHRVGKVAHGVAATVAGTGKTWFAADGGKAVEAELNALGKLAGDGAGKLYIADTANRPVRMVTPDGTISTVAGNGTPGSAGDGGLATFAQLHLITGLSSDHAGNLLIADLQEHRVLLVVRAAVPPSKSRPVKTLSG